MAITKFLVAMTGSFVVAADQCQTTGTEYFDPANACCVSSSSCNSTLCGTRQCKDAFDKIINNVTDVVAGVKNCTGNLAMLAQMPAAYFKGEACKKREACGFDACPLDPKNCDDAAMFIGQMDTVCPDDSCNTSTKCREYLAKRMTDADVLLNTFKSCPSKDLQKIAGYGHGYMKGAAYEKQVKCGFLQSPCNMNTSCFEPCGELGPIADCANLTKVLDGCGSSCNVCYKDLLRSWICTDPGQGSTDNAPRMLVGGHIASLVLGTTLAVVGLA